jgi:N-acetylglucosaminyldiphosphoundecaprenol N-acetyl-beta-D-mannosaminyltransferase
MELLGIRVDNLLRNEILEKVKFFLSENKFHRIATVNPEFILEAQKNEKFYEILNRCDLNVADGAGIWFAYLRYGKYLKFRMAGIDLMMDILKMANNMNLSIFLAAKSGGLSTWEETRDAILKIYPNLIIEGVNLEIGNPCSMLHASCSILFCNFGAPYQEIFINSLKYGNIRLAMGVGGSFDFLTGKTKRAPFFLRQLGLEWVWRIFQQKEGRLGRIKRIFRAVVIFPIKVILG